MFYKNIKIIKWQAGANSGDDFDFTEEPKNIGNSLTVSICIKKTRNTYLLDHIN